jgi:putative endonuclease
VAQHNQLGAIGENMAIELLAGKGYKILHTNWRYNHKEIDIVCMADGYLVIVEVKTRTEDMFEEPWQAVTNRKIKFLADATEAYIEKFSIEDEVRFDVVSIVLGDGAPHIEHIENAFRPWMC